MTFISMTFISLILVRRSWTWSSWTRLGPVLLQPKFSYRLRSHLLLLLKHLYLYDLYLHDLYFTYFGVPLLNLIQLNEAWASFITARVLIQAKILLILAPFHPAEPPYAGRVIACLLFFFFLIWISFFILPPLCWSFYLVTLIFICGLW